MPKATVLKENVQQARQRKEKVAHELAVFRKGAAMKIDGAGLGGSVNSKMQHLEGDCRRDVTTDSTHF